jgi:hypothetical protein
VVPYVACISRLDSYRHGAANLHGSWAKGVLMASAGEILQRVMDSRRVDRCLFCEGEPSYFGVFVPNNSSEWGAARGKQRLFFYAMSEKCFSETDPESREDRAEKIFAQSVRAAIESGGGARCH